MKIELTVEEAKTLLNCNFGTKDVSSVYPKIPKPEVEVLTSREIHNHIDNMCRSKSVTLYINNIKVYQSKKPDYDEIAEFLIPFDDEIVSIKEIENTWYVNTI